MNSLPAFPLVVLLGHFVQHTWRYLDGIVTVLVQEINDSCEAEAGTGAFGPLVQNLSVLWWIEARTQTNQGGLVRPVTNIWNIALCINLELIDCRWILLNQFLPP